MKREAYKLDNIAFIKTIMMIVVVIHHCCLFFGGDWFSPVEPIGGGDYLYSIARWMKTFNIQTFAMASGFLFYYLWIEKGRYNEPKKDIKKRAKRLLVPYFFTGVLWAIPIGCLFYHYSLNELFDKFVLMTGPAQLWFLIMLFIVFVFFELIGKRIKLSFGNLVLISFITTLVGGLLSVAHFNYFQLAVSVKYILFFYLGGYIYEYKNRISWKQTIIMMVLAIILNILILYFRDYNVATIRYGIKFIEPLVSVLEVSSIYFLCSRLVSKYGSIINNKFYKLLEENSFGIYLFHQQVIYFTIVWLNGIVSPILQATLSFVIATCVSLTMSVVLKKWQVTRWMFGL